MHFTKSICDIQAKTVAIFAQVRCSMSSPGQEALRDAWLKAPNGCLNALNQETLVRDLRLTPFAAKKVLHARDDFLGR